MFKFMPHWHTELTVSVQITVFNSRVCVPGAAAPSAYRPLINPNYSFNF